MAASQPPPLTRSRRPPPWLAPAEAPPAETDPTTGGPATLARALRSLSADRGRGALAPLVTLLVTWTGAFVLLWSAAVGAVLGILVVSGAIGVSGTTEALFGSGPMPGSGVWHLTSGALAGASGTTLAVSKALFGSPWGLAASLGVGSAVAVLLVAIGGVAETQLLTLRRYRRPTMGELRRLAQALQGFGAALRGPEVPAFVIADSACALVVVGSAHVVVSTGVLDTLDQEELAAVLCRGVHQWNAGLGSWRALLLACGWPLFALERLGHGWAGPQQDRPIPGAGSLLVRSALWPASVLVRLVVVPMAGPWRQRAEYDADDAVAGAGHGAGLSAALTKLSAMAPPPRGVDAVVAAGVPPTALRIERLGPVRPLDAFFREPKEGPTGATLRRRWAVAGVAVAVLLLAGGSAVNASDKASARHMAVRSAAAYTVSYLDALFRPGGDHDVVSGFVPARRVTQVDAGARSSVLALATVLAGADAAESEARATACRYVASPRTAGTAWVSVQTRWDYRLGRIPHRVLLTSEVTMALVEGRWQPVSAPAVSAITVGHRESGAGGALSCR